ncbi:hypothetical protein D8674_035124 [Pyrus ussuriensis x Pyrus communis]|uniref:Uncharacterized protein n=1 Tax=Pyrus ussuriensis x Pyrus communis TaxID=2448454 RepID=A0A5N5GBZ2_9ROSA|nr:hypothetical protein D8674_035124 [Pyrus ussuriensis x Pyrus communis]
MRVDFDTSKPLMTFFSMPCSKFGSYTIRLRYEGLRSFVTGTATLAILVAAHALHDHFCLEIAV